MTKQLILNLACGMTKGESNEQNEVINIDINPACKPDRVHDIKYGLPYADDTADRIICEHYIEHLTGEEFIRFFNECHRVLKPGGTLHLKAPYYTGKWAFIDPTHKKFVMENSFDFFINKDYNSISAGVTGYYEPIALNIHEGELSCELKKMLGDPKGNWHANVDVKT